MLPGVGAAPTLFVSAFPPPFRFALQVAGYDRQGMLHSLSHALWESDTTVFKAHITTSPNGKVSDM